MWYCVDISWYSFHVISRKADICQYNLVIYKLKPDVKGCQVVFKEMKWDWFLVVTVRFNNWWHIVTVWNAEPFICWIEFRLLQFLLLCIIMTRELNSKHVRFAVYLIWFSFLALFSVASYSGSTGKNPRGQRKTLVKITITVTISSDSHYHTLSLYYHHHHHHHIHDFSMFKALYSL